MKTLFSLILVALTIIPLLPFVSAQYAGIGGGGNQTLEEDLKLAREKVRASYYNPAPTPPTYLFQNPLLVIIPVIIACGGISFLIFIKSRRPSSGDENETRK